MKKALIVIIVLAAAAAGGYLLLGRSNPAQETPPAQTEETDTAAESPSPATEAVTVNYNGSAFSPASITVTPGTKVNFINQSTSPMWVASDPHPVHTDFSAFDANRSYGQGETYSFTFSEEGSYGYHNHLNSGVTGTVTVR